MTPFPSKKALAFDQATAATSWALVRAYAKDTGLRVLPEGLNRWRATFKSFPWAYRPGSANKYDAERLTIEYDRRYNVYVVSDFGGFITLVESFSTIEDWLRDLPRGGVRELVTGKPRYVPPKLPAVEPRREQWADAELDDILEDLDL